MRPISISSTSISNRKERACIEPGPGSLRLGFSWSSVFYSRSRLSGKSRSHWPRAQSRFLPRSRKRSVPGRVHSIPKSSGSLVAPPGASGVQPISDSRHGRITCKSFFTQLLKSKTAATSNQPTGLLRPTPLLVNGGSQNHVLLMAKTLLEESRRPQSVL
jgi:hypothetical protein